jgi:hypothetical protein
MRQMNNARYVTNRLALSNQIVGPGGANKFCKMSQTIGSSL